LGRLAQRIVVTCDEIYQKCIQQGVHRDELVVIPCAARECRDSIPDRRQIWRELGLPFDARVITCACPLVPSSRLKDLMWTADLLKVVYDDVHLVIIGDGPQHWRLQRYRRQLHIEDRVHLLGGRTDVGRLISASDIYWVGGQEPAQSGEILTAMAASVPVLAVDSPAARGLIIPERTGVLFPMGNRAALARRTKALLDDSRQAQRIGEAGRHSVSDNYSVDRMVEEYGTLYHRLLSR
jgi:glycosyltransferase involved in cell wall biosynthesis